MNRYISLTKRLAIWSLLCTMLGMGSVRAADIAQVPLFISLAAVNPNIMFVLDDSGSMQFEGPEEYVDSGTAVYLFPPPSSTNSAYGTGSPYASGRIFGPNDNDPRNALLRSYKFNPFYYNPSITYKPWIKADGTSYADAAPTAAYHNPYITSKGSLNLTGDITNSRWYSCSNKTTGTGCTVIGQTCTTNKVCDWRGRNCQDVTTCVDDNECEEQTCSTSSTSKSIWPATYFRHDGGSSKKRSNYTKIEIKPTTTTYSGEGRESRTDTGCTDGTCTYAAEIQNFANWYTYHRSRILAARAGIGRAFMRQNESLRVGFSTINTINSTNNYLSAFNQTGRESFLTNLYGCNIPAQGTPLLTALNAAGNYFSRTDTKGPWTDVPGTTSGTTYSCRRSYTILMTDGYWNGGIPSGEPGKNNDGTEGSTITGPDGKSYTYKPIAPFKDDNAGTLADVAMYYWKNDLHKELDNRVPLSVTDPAFWQHMVTFGVAFGVEGSIKKADAFAAILDKEKAASLPAWPKPSDTGESENVDDLLHAAVNSRGGYFSAKEPDAFANELSGLLQEIVARQESSASSLASNSTYAKTGTMTYQAKFNSDGWSGRIIAYPMRSNGTLDEPKWTTDQSGKIPAHDSRKIYTMVGIQGQEFKWANLDSAQQTALKTLQTVIGSDTLGQQRLNWIRGDQSQEKQNGGVLRQRNKLLGDIVNSDPMLVNGVLYVGANDGMLHAFDAENGVEKFAYIPKAVIPNLSMLTDPGYSHQYYVDGSPVVQTFDDGGTSKTILVGTTGAGGRSIFALDITDPNSFNQNKVMWEFNHANSTDLGYTLQKPVVGQLKNGTWVVIFGNGYNSNSGKAFLFVLNLKTGAVIAKIATNDATANGLGEPALYTDTDKRIFAVYAGDLQGNMWKFDLASNSVVFGKPLFIAKNASGVAQPITSAPAIGNHTYGGLLILFGTGKYFEVGDHSPTGIPVQSVYGIWDITDAQLGGTGTAITVTNRSVLQKQEILGESVSAGNNWRILSQNAVDWGTLKVPNKRGWYIDLEGPAIKDGKKVQVGERVTDTPEINKGRILVTTRLPFNAADPCIPSVGTSWILGFDMMTGGRYESSVFDVNRDNSFNQYDMIIFDGQMVAVSGFEFVAAGMSRTSLLQVEPGMIDILASGTTDLTTTSSSVQDANKGEIKAAVVANQAAQAAAENAAKAKAAADAAAADAAANPSNQSKQDASVAAADAAAEANRALAQAIAGAADKVMAAAQAIIDADAGGNSAESAKAAQIKLEAQALKSDIASYISSGNAIPTRMLAQLSDLVARLQGMGDVGTRFEATLDDPSQTWRQVL